MLKKIVILSLGMISLLGRGAMANADAERLRSRGSIAVAPGTFILYQHPTSEHMGAKATITQVARYKNYLFVYNDQDNGPQAIKYMSDSGARKDLLRIAGGESVDVTSCMVRDHLANRQSPIEANGYCTDYTYELRMDCGSWSTVPFADGADFDRYESRDIVKNPLMELDRRCLGSQPQSMKL